MVDGAKISIRVTPNWDFIRIEETKGRLYIMFNLMTDHLVETTVSGILASERTYTFKTRIYELSGGAFRGNRATLKYVGQTVRTANTVVDATPQHASWPDGWWEGTVTATVQTTPSAAPAVLFYDAPWMWGNRGGLSAYYSVHDSVQVMTQTVTANATTGAFISGASTMTLTQTDKNVFLSGLHKVTGTTYGATSTYTDSYSRSYVGVPPPGTPSGASVLASQLEASQSGGPSSILNVSDHFGSGGSAYYKMVDSVSNAAQYWKIAADGTRTVLDSGWTQPLPIASITPRTGSQPPYSHYETALRGWQTKSWMSQGNGVFDRRSVLKSTHANSWYWALNPTQGFSQYGAPGDSFLTAWKLEGTGIPANTVLDLRDLPGLAADTPFLDALNHTYSGADVIQPRWEPSSGVFLGYYATRTIDAHTAGALEVTVRIDQNADLVFTP